MNIKLSTPVLIRDKIVRKIKSNDKIIGVGSCFSEVMLNKLFSYGFEGMINPNGIVYNAVSIAKSFRRLEENLLYTKEEIFEYNKLWHSWEHHGSFSKLNLSETINAINANFNQFREMLIKANCIILTFSSSVIYELTESHNIVANCHKVPGNKFEKKLLTSRQNLESLRIIYSSIKKLNSNAMIIFTLSPVRHYPGNLQLNSVSKANLLSAITEFIDSINDSNCFYFPAFEILMDELRDYRFYKNDMLHPSELAEELIFNRFTEAFMTSDCREKIKESCNRLKRLKHKTFVKE